VLTGSVRREGEELLVGDAEGRLTRVAHDRVVELQALATSTLPAGLAEKLGPERLRDLLAFLVSPPLSMPDYGREAPPAPRAAAEVERVLAPALGPEPGLEPGPELEPPGAAAPAPSPPPVPPVPRPPPRRLSITLVDGPKDHGPGEHDYPAWRAVWGRLLSGAERVEVRTASGFPGEEDLAQADVIVFYQRGEWTEARAAAIDRFLARGGGLVYLHYAVDGGGDPEGFAARIGLAWVGGRSRFRHGPLELDFSPGRGHPVARGFERLEVVRFHDESYWRLAGDPAAVQVIASGIEDGAPEPLLWSVERGGGRVFVSILGHFAWTFDDPLFRLLVLRGIAWAAREPVDRLSDLVFPGARVLP
jgi:type 1 glutamine amidotransferase